MRNGNVINVPAWFIEDFPTQALDGELWMRRGQFERLSGTVFRQVPKEVEWRQVRYRVFELPRVLGTFLQRAQVMH